MTTQSPHFQESRETVRDFFLEGAKRLFARKGNGKLELGRYRITSPCDGMVDITDLKSVAVWRASSSLAGGTKLKEKAMTEGTSLILSIATLITITVVANFIVSIFT